MYDFHSPKQKTAIGSQETEPRPSNIIRIDQNLLETRLDRLITEKMTQILNAMLDAEADEITGAARYERSGGRKAYRAGHYERKLTAKAGRLELKVPKLKDALFESAVIERYRRREQSVEESLIDMYLAGVSTRQVDDISQLLWGDRMPSQTLSDKLKRIYGEIDQWRTRPLESKLFVFNKKFFEVVTFSWTSRPGGEPPYGEVQQGAARQGRGPVHQIRALRRGRGLATMY